MPERPGIEVSVNGEAVHVPAGSTLRDLLQRLELDRARVAVEHNLRVVPLAAGIAPRRGLRACYHRPHG